MQTDVQMPFATRYKPTANSTILHTHKSPEELGVDIDPDTHLYEVDHFISYLRC